MRTLVRFFVILVIAISSESCERDDICIDQVTPKFIIRFYDTENPELFKQVVNLKVNISGTDGDFINETITSLTDSIALPINVSGDLTRYVLTLQGSEAQETEDNIDNLQITYTQEDLFVSRPCGFEAVFIDVKPELQIDEDNWIDQIVIQSNPLDITNENSAHVKIYH